MSHDDALSLSMFWVGALMVFTPLVTAAVVAVAVWRRRVKDGREQAGREREALTISGDVTNGQEARGQ